MIPAVLREEPRYRLLFAGQTLSVVGDRIAFIALAFAVLSIGDLGDLGIVTAAASLPFLIVALPGGAISDRVGRRQVMLVADCARALIQAVSATLLLTGAAEIWMLAALMALYGTADAFFGPAMSGLIPQTVAEHRVQDANALIGLTMNVAMILGPAAAGVLLALTGPGEAIAIDSATFVASAIFLARLRPAEIAVADPGEEKRMLDSVREGWRIVRDSGWILPGISGLVAYHLFVLPSVFVLGPAIAEQDLSGATSWAAISTGFGVGAVIGNVVALRLKPSRTLVAAFAAMMLASLQGAFLASGLGTAGIAALELVAGIGVSIFFTLWDSTVQEQVPEDATARVAAYDWAASVGLMPVGLALAGPAGELLGVDTAMRAGTVLGIGAALVCLSVPAVRHLRRRALPPAAAAPS